ncbi:Numb-associated kinase [Strongyloides ratti]|uniref:non-specific serine/threonine protein kinase n=1 Tax=Strongyloides ratti TaxID=34506 RepID=A0A090KRU1_STRRB|nr:Numb-associated kinase [Strongyloides ratti]CEF60110.1 Numb-associated kinase [Strongyloides ratti]
MPLGSLFGGSSGSSLKPQPLSNEKKEKSSSFKSGLVFNADIKKTTSSGKKTTIKLNKMTFTIEKQIAEGGFAIVFLVSDKNHKYYALKRQLIRDDNPRLESCKREANILKTFAGHKNIAKYETHLITQNKAGISEYMLLTSYYPSSVFQLMNERLKANQTLRLTEIFNIFEDICHAVYALHTSNPPIIHRDLKIENILIDTNSGVQHRPTYVLCDFGSCTKEILSLKTHGLNYIIEEINKCTTLSYRAPEMVDLYEENTIGVSSDIWALGVLLFKLCYFQLPFGESSLAIQNGHFTFPDNKHIPESLKALISACLTPKCDLRPNIYQLLSLILEISGLSKVLKNHLNSPKLPLEVVISNYKKRFNIPLDSDKKQISGSVNDIKNDKDLIVNEKSFDCIIDTKRRENDNNLSTGSTTINPRLRPRPSTMNQKLNLNTPTLPKEYTQNESKCTPNVDENFADFDSYQESLSAKNTAPPIPLIKSPNSDSLLRASAFKPYYSVKSSMTASIGSNSSVSEKSNGGIESTINTIDPFTSAPFIKNNNEVDVKEMNDQDFVKQFDKLRNNSQKNSNKSSTSGFELEPYERHMIETDPFGYAPFTPVKELSKT